MADDNSPDLTGKRFGTVGGRADAELFGEDLTVAEHSNLIDLDNLLRQLGPWREARAGLGAKQRWHRLVNRAALLSC